jgi:hypothetical protein
LPLGLLPQWNGLGFAIYQFKPGSTQGDFMEIVENFDFNRFMSKLGTGENAMNLLMAALKT